MSWYNGSPFPPAPHAHLPPSPSLSLCRPHTHSLTLSPPPLTLTLPPSHSPTEELGRWDAHLVLSEHFEPRIEKVLPHAFSASVEADLYRYMTPNIHKSNLKFRQGE